MTGPITKQRKSFLLSPKAEAHLDRRIRGYGDLSRLVLEAVNAVDLAMVTVAQRPSHRGVLKSDLRPRQVLLDDTAYARIQSAAERRGVSINALVDAAVVAYFDAKSSKPPRGPKATE